jgi:hypothetical protein
MYVYRENHQKLGNTYMVLYTNLWISFVRRVWCKYKDIARCTSNISLRCVFCESWEHRLAISCSRCPVYPRYHFLQILFFLSKTSRRAFAVPSFQETVTCSPRPVFPRHGILQSLFVLPRHHFLQSPPCRSKTSFPVLWPKLWELENFGGDEAKEYLLHSCWHRSYRAQNYHAPGFTRTE